jgi:hypothetical protein
MALRTLQPNIDRDRDGNGRDDALDADERLDDMLADRTRANRRARDDQQRQLRDHTRDDEHSRGR